jgi:dTDP-4-amino-4,6-dideoxygalactose transaminase
MAERLALSGGAPLRTTPFHRWPDWDASERAALSGVLEDGSWGGYPSPNKYAGRFAQEFSSYLGSAHGVCCTNGSVAIELALQAAGIGPGDEVIVPAYTFVATASSAALVRAVPIFVDVSPETYCIDPERIAEAITPRTRAIIVVHLACNMADMDAILALAKKHSLIVIEDCAHAHGHRWKGQAAGSIGDLATFSFQTSKLMTAGEGGIVVTSNSAFAMRLDSLVNCGRKEDGKHTYRGQVMGRNSRISEWQAAVLSCQLARLEAQTELREQRTAAFQARLEGMPGISFTTQDPRNTTRAAYQFIVKYDPAGWGGAHRNRFLEALRAEGVPAEGDFYVPLYEDPLFAMDPVTNPLCNTDFSLDRFDCPVTAKAAYEEAIWLPHQLFLGSAEDVADVAAAFEKIHANREDLQ